MTKIKKCIIYYTNSIDNNLPYFYMLKPNKEFKSKNVGNICNFIIKSKLESKCFEVKNPKKIRSINFKVLEMRFINKGKLL